MGGKDLNFRNTSTEKWRERENLQIQFWNFSLVLSRSTETKQIGSYQKVFLLPGMNFQLRSQNRQNIKIVKASKQNCLEKRSLQTLSSFTMMAKWSDQGWSDQECQRFQHLWSSKHSGRVRIIFFIKYPWASVQGTCSWWIPQWGWRTRAPQVSSQGRVNCPKMRCDSTCVVAHRLWQEKRSREFRKWFYSGQCYREVFINSNKSKAGRKCRVL